MIQIKSESKHSLLDEYDLNDKFVIGYSGNMGRFHDMETIMEVAKRFHSHPDIVFLFVGEGHKKKWCREFVDTHGLTQCYFSTYVPVEELGQLLHSFDIGLACLLSNQTGLSVPSKSYGILAAGIPLIAIMNTDCEIVQMIQEFDCGCTCVPGDVDRLESEILRLYSDAVLRDRISQNGLNVIHERYNLNVISESYLKLLS